MCDVLKRYVIMPNEMVSNDFSSFYPRHSHRVFVFYFSYLRLATWVSVISIFQGIVSYFILVEGKNAESKLNWTH